MLTRKQHQLLMFINERLTEAGVSPSFEEMKEALGLKSKSGIHRLITALEERGFIRRLAHRARALEIMKMPEEAANMQGRPATTGFSPKVVSGSFLPSRPAASSETEVVSLPLHGRIAAGTPIEALRDENTTIEVPASQVKGGDHYALEVAGESMIDAGILDGDTVIIQRSDTAENGSIVVALVDGQEVTLKRLRRKGAMVALEAANRAFETRLISADRVEIQGKLVGLYRQYV